MIFEQSETTYDAASNVLMQTSRQRFHDASGTGPLQGPSGSQPKSRDSYVANWYDGIGRTIASANYGTNNNVALLAAGLPIAPPNRSNLILVASTRYNERGEAFETTDPAGIIQHLDFDQEGRVVRTIQNFQPDATRSYAPDTYRNIVVERVYGPGGQLERLIAQNPQTGPQITRYLYNATLPASDIASHDLLTNEIYPDSTNDATDSVTYTYNRQGQRTSMQDQNGTVHEYDYDALGRPVADRVATLGTNIDGAVRRIEREYEVRGMVTRITSYNSATSGSVVNEVVNTYDNRYGQFEKQYQAHDGAVSFGSTPVVVYDRANGSGVPNSTRLKSMTYPDGRKLDYLYDDTDADKLSRMRTLHWDTTGVNVDVCQYSYLGLNTFVQANYPEPQVMLDYATGSNANPYAGFDRFGRIIDHWWHRPLSSSSSSASSGAPSDDVVHLQYGYDRASNRTYRRDEVARGYGQKYDELYQYDNLQRLTGFYRGTLTVDNQALSTGTTSQNWTLDSTGNWQAFSQNADGTFLTQQRSANEANEITSIKHVVSDAWAKPTYDDSGNMTIMPRPLAPVESFQATYDAWNRLVKLTDGPNKIQEYQYDGQNWRTVVKTYSSSTLSEVRHCYYSSDWRCVQEYIESLTTFIDRTYIWGLRAMDDLIYRDTVVDLFYICSDALGSNVAQLDSSGTITNRLAYQPYGESISLNSDFTPAAIDVDWEYRFAGYRYDSPTGLYHVRHRYLNSALGTWVSRDPIGYGGGDVNLLRYVVNRVIAGNDPYGNIIIFVEGIDTDISNTDSKELYTGLQDYWSTKRKTPHAFIYFNFPAATRIEAANKLLMGHQKGRYNTRVAKSLLSFVNSLESYRNGKYHNNDCKEPIFVIGFSNGTNIVRNALSQGMKVTGVVFIGSAIENEEDLQEEIRNTNFIINFHSSADWAASIIPDGAGSYGFRESGSSKNTSLKGVENIYAPNYAHSATGQWLANATGRRNIDPHINKWVSKQGGGLLIGPALEHARNTNCRQFNGAQVASGKSSVQIHKDGFNVVDSGIKEYSPE